jgi:hypothetical protein
MRLRDFAPLSPVHGPPAPDLEPDVVPSPCGDRHELLARQGGVRQKLVLGGAKVLERLL